MSIDTFLGATGASWSPLYDLHATSEGGKPSESVSLHYRVNLQQTTGEDWKDTKLILSTSATDMLDAGVPASDSLTVQPKERPPPPPAVVAVAAPKRKFKLGGSLGGPDPDSLRTSASLPGSRYGSDAPSPPRPTPLPPMVQTTAVVSKSPMAVSYTVDEYTTIPSNSLSHKVLVAIIPFEATISHITSPRKSPVSYLQVGILPSVHPV